MKEAIDQIFKELADLKAASAKEVEEARIRFLGKKGEGMSGSNRTRSQRSWLALR